MAGILLWPWKSPPAPETIVFWMASPFPRATPGSRGVGGEVASKYHLLRSSLGSGEQAAVLCSEVQHHLPSQRAMFSRRPQRREPSPCLRALFSFPFVAPQCPP